MWDMEEKDNSVREAVGDRGYGESNHRQDT